MITPRGARFGKRLATTQVRKRTLTYLNATASPHGGSLLGHIMVAAAWHGTAIRTLPLPRHQTPGCASLCARGPHAARQRSKRPGSAGQAWKGR